MPPATLRRRRRPQPRTRRARAHQQQDPGEQQAAGSAEHARRREAASPQAKPADAPAPAPAQPVATSPIAPRRPLPACLDARRPACRAAQPRDRDDRRDGPHGGRAGRQSRPPEPQAGRARRHRGAAAQTAEGIHALLVADSPEAARMLASAGDDLRRQLEDKNVNLLSLDVSTSSEQAATQPAAAFTDGFGDDTAPRLSQPTRGNATRRSWRRRQLPKPLLSSLTASSSTSSPNPPTGPSHMSCHSSTTATTTGRVGLHERREPQCDAGQGRLPEAVHRPAAAPGPGRADGHERLDAADVLVLHGRADHEHGEHEHQDRRVAEHVFRGRPDRPHGHLHRLRRGRCTPARSRRSPPPRTASPPSPSAARRHRPRPSPKSPDPATTNQENPLS